MPFRPTRIAAPLAVLAALALGSGGGSAQGPFEDRGPAPAPPAHAHEPPAAVPHADTREVTRRNQAIRRPAPPAADQAPREPKPVKEPEGQAAREKATPEPAPTRRKRRRLPPADTVNGAIARAHRSGAVTRGEHTRYRETWSRVRAVSRGPGGGELAAAAGVVRRVAERRRLRSDRMPVLFLQLRRNLQLVRSGRRLAPGERVTFGRDPVIFQYVPGQGLQFHPLANFAEANRLRNACVGYRTRPGVPCRKRRLGRLANRMAALAVERAGFKTWEYYFDFSGGRAPWISAMSQATGMQAISRAGKLLKRRRYVRVARAARGAFHRATPAGVRVADGNYAMYSFAPQLLVFNGLLQTVSGLHDYAEISGDRRAKRLFGTGDRLARRLIPTFDTGSWSLYSQPGGRATREYHELTSTFLGNLCERTERKSYCAAAKRFRSYL